MGRMDREVNIFSDRDPSAAPGWQWWAGVEGRHGITIYATPRFRTQGEALSDAESWAKANGYHWPPF